MNETLFWIAANLFLFLVGYFFGVHGTRPTETDAVALKNLLEQHENAVIAYYADPSDECLAALKAARTKLAWWRTNV